jgi:hypothetical protein
MMNLGFIARADGGTIAALLREYDLRVEPPAGGRDRRTVEIALLSA